jgi:hypothetical protein
VFEREKRVASVHRRKSERCLALFLCTGKGRESEKALWRRAKHKECGDVGGALGEDHTPLDLLVTDKERLRLSCSVTMYKGDRTRKTNENC